MASNRALTFLFLLLVAGPLVAADPDKHELMMQTFKMTAADATALEAQISANGDDLADRFKLMNFYIRNQSYQQAAAHYRWLVEHHPASDFLDQSHFSLLYMQLAGQDVQTIIKLWRDQIDKDSTNVQLLANAASAFQHSDEQRAIELLEKASKLDPKNPEWHGRLGRLYSYAGGKHSEKDNSLAARKSYESFEQALNLSGPADRYFRLREAAEAAFLVGEWEKARRYAGELLDRAVQSPADWNYGNAVHHGNLILGHVALHEGKVEQAEDFLMRAGKTSGSPQLNSFGPNMSLALELLKKGRKEKVIEYLELCKKFWKDPDLATWIQTIQTGGTPDFGANLDY